MTPLTFAPVSMSPSQAFGLEARMKQQVQDAILARKTQHLKGNKLDSNWRLIASLGQLKTFKFRNTDSFSSTPFQSTILERSSQVKARNIMDEHIRTPTWSTRGHNSARKYHGGLPFARRTMGPSIGGHETLGERPLLQSYRTFGRIQGNYRDIVAVHYATNSADFVQQQKLLSPVAIDGAVLHTIRATKDSFLGIKWLAENSFVGKRDMCYVEMIGYTTDTNGQEIGFVALASVDVPECPELTKLMKLTRIRMKRTMLIIPTADAPKTTSEVFVMDSSESNESSIVALAQYRLNMGVLNDLSLVIDSQNIAHQRLARHENWVPDVHRLSCTICNRKFHFAYRRRHHCRLCGDIVCKTCYVTRAVSHADREGEHVCKSTNATLLCQTKFCVRCVMDLRVVDKQVDKFPEQMSKMVSLDMDTSNVERESLSSKTRDSSITYFKRGTKMKHTLDLDQLYAISSSQSVNPRMDHNDKFHGTNDQVPVAGSLYKPECFEPSRSVDPGHKSSHCKFCRHNFSSLDDESAGLYAEKVTLKIDKFSRMVAI